MSETETVERRRTMAALGAGLRRLHRALITTAQREYERTHGRVAGPVALLRLLTDDPQFAWLRPLSQLILAVDDAADAKAPGVPSAAEFAALRDDAVALLDGTRADSPFAQPYLAALQNDPDVALEHSAVRATLGAPTRPS